MENNKITIDDVLKFIDEYGYIYGARIRDTLDKQKKNINTEIKEILDNRNDMYKKLID